MLILFLDRDHVMTLAWQLLQEPTPAQEQWLRGFFAPEAVDLAALRALGHGLRPSDGVASAWFEPGKGSLTQAQALVFRRGTVDRTLLQSAPRLRLVQRLGAGADGIALDAAGEQDVQVSCLPRRSLARTAEHALLLMLAGAKRLLEADAAVRSGAAAGQGGRYGQVAYNWPGLAGIGGLEGRTLGIVGLGEVGRLVAVRARAFGMRVLYANRRPLGPAQERTLAVEWRPLERLLAESDFVTLHVPNTDDNERLLDRAAIARMRPGAFLVNTSRGRIVDEDALYEALVEGRLRGAGLDVHATEPRPRDRFADLPNVVLTPHLAGGSRLGVLEELEDIFTNLRAALRGEPVPHAAIACAAEVA
ncbi:MAG TPA: NAD(P)-dependent oxidoreductase [Ramlibacter sp.]|nr:NAD(P)-dependent oxidoreductase [Ramlibacter sp.]